MRAHTLYKNKYLIGIYLPIEEGETLVALCANALEFALLMGISRDDAIHILRYLYKGDTQRIRFRNKMCSVSFIEE